jgi:hypothetical protein
MEARSLLTRQIVKLQDQKILAEVDALADVYSACRNRVRIQARKHPHPQTVAGQRPQDLRSEVAHEELHRRLRVNVMLQESTSILSQHHVGVGVPALGSKARIGMHA